VEGKKKILVNSLEEELACRIWLAFANTSSFFPLAAFVLGLPTLKVQ
jgi:hypothetical protein